MMCESAEQRICIKFCFKIGKTAMETYQLLQQAFGEDAMGHTQFDFFFFQVLNFLVESFGLLNDVFPLPSILDAGYPVLDLHLADVLFNVILPSVLGSSL